MIDDLYDVLEPAAVEGDGGGATIMLRLHVQPGAGRTEVCGRHGDALKVKVAAPPEGGRANQAVLDLVGRILGAKPAQVELASGQSSRSKRVRITGVEPGDVSRILDEELASGNNRGGRGVRPTAR